MNSNNETKEYIYKGFRCIIYFVAGEWHYIAEDKNERTLVGSHFKTSEDAVMACDKEIDLE